MTALLQAKGLVRRYPARRGLLGRPTYVHAVNGVSLQIEKGETLGIVGESGCGKSSTGRLLLGLESCDEGQVIFDGKPLPQEDSPDWRQLRTRMQMVFQDPLGALDPRLTVGAQIGEPLEIHGIGTSPEQRESIAATLGAVGLGARHAALYPHQLSGGQRQRAVLARALITRPDLLVCDEPISALDISIQAQVINLLNDLQGELGMAMLFISHDLRAVRQISHRIAIMYLGQIIEEGPTDDIIADPHHPYAQALVSAIPQIGRRPGTRTILQGDPPNPANRPSGCAFHPDARWRSQFANRQPPR